MVKITYPEHAGRVKGPDVTVKWSAKDAKQQQISIDGAEFKDVPIDQQSYTIHGLAQGLHTVTILINHTQSVSVSFYAYNLAQLSDSILYTLDLKHLHIIDIEDNKQTTHAFDTLHCIAVLQGIVNRHKPQLYINYQDADAFWLEKMRAKGAYLEHVKLKPLASIEAAITAFAEQIKGVVVWDPNVPSTSNVASTICGVENLIPVRYDTNTNSLYQKLIMSGPKLKVIHNLVGMFDCKGKIPGTDRESTGSAKCDSYLWAKIHYIDTGKCNPAEIGYWCDAFWLQAPKDMGLSNVGLTNHDFVVARRGFFCDLNVWTDEAPRDDRTQRLGLDRDTLCEIFLSCYNGNKGGMIHFSGFTPWAIKYTDHGNAGGNHDGVPTEWETTRIASSYNCYMDADAIGYVGMANASVFQHSPLPDRLIQNLPPTRRELEKKGYIDKNGKIAPYNFLYHYLGDYDSAAWLYNCMPRIWSSSARGEVPSGWAFNPNLMERLPLVFDWCYDTKSPLDYFIAGDSGAGYVNPTELLPPRKISELPSGADAWIKHNINYFRRFNYSITGFIINAFSGELTDESNKMYTSFSGDGVMTQMWMPKDKNHDHLLDNMPVAHMEQDIVNSPEDAVKEIVKYGKPGETCFMGFRSILKDPNWIKTVNDSIREARPECNFEPVDPYTYFYLLRHSLGGSNDKRATYTFDTLPDNIEPGKKIKIAAGLRNDGWDTWNSKGGDAVMLTARFGDKSTAVVCGLPNDVEPGEGVIVEFTILALEKPAEYDFTLELRRGTNEWFGDAGDLPWVKQVRIM